MKRALFIANITLLSCGSDVVTLTNEVLVVEQHFRPESINVKVGDTVTWTLNNGANNHTITSGTNCQPATDNGEDMDVELAPFQRTTFRHEFTHVGEVHYFCREHCASGMTGVVFVIQ
jgi:plastocyanin